MDRNPLPTIDCLLDGKRCYATGDRDYVDLPGRQSVGHRFARGRTSMVQQLNRARARTRSRLQRNQPEAAPSLGRCERQWLGKRVVLTPASVGAPDRSPARAD
jgi:hypothetical protein